MSVSRKSAAVTFAVLASLFALVAWVNAQDEPSEEIAQQRFDVMKQQAMAIAISSPADGVPSQLEPEPLFRYDDHTRGYVDGLVWRLGETGRPLAIITTELHPDYYGRGPKIVYDLLSLTDNPLRVTSNAFQWSPQASFAHFQPVEGPGPPGPTEGVRLAQMRKLAEEFSVTQVVDEQINRLRLLPKPIDRYQPDDHARSDGAMFLLVSGRNPGLILLIETDGEGWRWGIGRLSAPSTFEVRLDEELVWNQPLSPNYGSTKSYYAANRESIVPGY